MEKTSIFNHLHFSNPTTDQKKVLTEMQSFITNKEDDFFILCGAAGTGKTSITAAVIGYLNKVNKAYKIAAPTGRAARILGRKANTTASTIHSMIYNTKTDSKTGKVSFHLKNGFNSQPTLYIIDEASMIPENGSQNNELFSVQDGLIFDLIKYIKTANSKNQIFFLGDHYQLPPIGENKSCALSKEFLKSKFNLTGNSHLLTEVKRQDDGSYILQNATNIRQAIDKNITNHPIQGESNYNIHSAVDNYIRKKNSHGSENSIAIGVSNKANHFFNRLVRDKIFGKAKKVLEPGDVLMVTQNWKRNGISLYNGDQVELLSVDWSLQEQVSGLHFVPVKLKLLFTENETIIEDFALVETLINPGGKVDSKKESELRRHRYIKNQILRESNRPSDDRYVGAIRLMYGHAITCNKAQGGEWNTVFINTWGIPSLNWQYTAVTRGISEIQKF